MSPTWAVACTTIEAPAQAEAFAAHHLALGASRVLLFLDEPRDAAAYDLDGPVAVVACDEAHWRGRRPADHRHRQTRNAEAARRLAGTDWVASLDADEFLLPRGGSVAELLAAVPEGIGAWRVPAAERAAVGGWRDDALDLGGVAKLRREGERLGRRLWGERIGRAFPDGFQGHSLGKSFLRTERADLRFRIHLAVGAAGPAPEAVAREEEALLLHCFPTSFPDWLSKFARRAGSPERLAAMSARERRKYELHAAWAREGGEPRRLFEALCVLGEAEAAALVAEGRALRIEPPDLGALRASLPRRALPPLPGGLRPAVRLVGAADPAVLRLLAARGWGEGGGVAVAPRRPGGPPGPEGAIPWVVELDKPRDVLARIEGAL